MNHDREAVGISAVTPRDILLKPDKLQHSFFEPWSPEKLLLWAIRECFPRVGLTCSLSVEDTVLAHMIQQIEPRVPIIFIDTGYHFEETLELKERLGNVFDWNLVEFLPLLTVEEQQELEGSELYRSQPDKCCEIRKVEPMRRALQTLDVWVTGLRRGQAATRRDIAKVERHGLDDGRALIKLNPLADWDRSQVWGYIHSYRLPYNDLYEHNYASIGCEPCTQPVSKGEHERSGRWRGANKTECGLHTFTQRNT